MPCTAKRRKIINLYGTQDLGVRAVHDATPPVEPLACGHPVLLSAGGVDVSAEGLCRPHLAAKRAGMPPLEPPYVWEGDTPPAPPTDPLPPGAQFALEFYVANDGIVEVNFPSGSPAEVALFAGGRVPVVLRRRAGTSEADLLAASEQFFVRVRRGANTGGFEYWDWNPATSVNDFKVRNLVLLMNEQVIQVGNDNGSNGANTLIVWQGTLEIDVYATDFPCVRWDLPVQGANPGLTLTDGEPHLVQIVLRDGFTAQNLLDASSNIAWFDNNGQIGKFTTAGADTPIEDAIALLEKPVMVTHVAPNLNR